MLKIAIIGRPNVGKSTLFNRLCKSNLAIVHDYSGVTRDVKEHIITIKEKQFILYDTAGLEEIKCGKSSLLNDMTYKTIETIKLADIILFVVDLMDPINPIDTVFANFLKKEYKNVILIANKVDIKTSINNISDLYRFGFGDILPISSEHGIGLSKLQDVIFDLSNKILDVNFEQDTHNLIQNKDADDVICISIIGRPNVGKSTLINALIHKDKLLVSNIAGTTRDSIDSKIKYNNKEIIIIDTAGVRKKNKIDLSLESLSIKQTFASIRRSDISVLVLDANISLDKQDIVLIDYANSVGNAIIVVANKIDTVQSKTEIEKSITSKLEISFNQIKNIPFIMVSANKKQGLKKLLDTIINIFTKLNKQFSTGQLNKCLQSAIINNPPSLSRLKRPMKFKYVTQTGIKPYEFTIFTGGATQPSDSYERYLINFFRSNLKLGGIPIKLLFKKSKNPYC